MIWTRLALVTLVSAATATPAVAQYKKRPNRVTAKAPFAADAWGPKEGRAGTRCWVDGRGFRKNMTVLVGGRPVQLVEFAPGRIEFDIPRRYGDGRIILRRRGHDDVFVGRFNVLPDPAIARFGPRSGLPGTRVEIRGAGFYPGLRVMMNGRTIRADDIDPRRIVFRIPAWAKSDYIELVDDGYKIRTRRPFDVLSPVPLIRNVSPASGGYGTVVRVSGDHFDGREQVFYGRRPVREVKRGNGWVEFTVPDWARRPRRIRVRNQYGESTWPHRFGLVQAPIVSSLDPVYGPPGTLVTIRGRHLGRDRARVTWGPRKPLRVVKSGPGYLTVVIPRRASGEEYLFVEHAGQRVRSGGKFRVSAPAVIDRLTPRRSWRGGTLVIHGEGFGPKVRVRVDGSWWPIKRIGKRGRRIWVEVPRDAPHRGRHWVEVVKAGGYVARSPDKLILVPPPGSNVRDKRY